MPSKVDMRTRPPIPAYERVRVQREKRWAKNMQILQREESRVPELCVQKVTPWRYKLTYRYVVVDVWPSTNAVRLRAAAKTSYMDMTKLLNWLYDEAGARP